jgi:acetate---CoA ligase (ADP-forming)
VPELECDREEGRAVVREAVTAGGGWLDAEQTHRLLEAYGIPLVPERVVATTPEAVEAARDLGYPVVLKTAAPGAHKTEQGGIALDLADEAAVLDAAERIHAPLLVQPFVRGGAELLAGAVQDPVFGPLVAFGPGGVLAELIGEAQFRLAPLTDLDAEELVHSGKPGRLVAGFRGTPPADEGALVDLLLRLSLLVEELPEVVELDLNPVLGLPDRCLAVDARVRVAEHGPAHRTKSW